MGEEIVDDVTRSVSAILSEIIGIRGGSEDVGESDQELSSSFDTDHRVRRGDLHGVGDLARSDLGETNS